MKNSSVDLAAYDDTERSRQKAPLRRALLTCFIISALALSCLNSSAGPSRPSREENKSGNDVSPLMTEREAIFWGDCEYDPVIPAYGPENVCAGLNAAFIWGGHSRWAFEELYKKDLDVMFEGGSWTEYNLSENPTIMEEELLQYQVVYVEDPYRNGFNVATWLEGDGAGLLETVADLGVAVFVNIYTLRDEPIPLPYGARLEKTSPLAVSMTFPEPIQYNELYEGEFQGMKDYYFGWAAAFEVSGYPGWMKPLTVNGEDPDQALSVGGRTKLGNRVLLSGMNHPLYWGDTPEAFHLRANMFQYVCDNGELELESISEPPTSAPTDGCIPEPAWLHCADWSLCFSNVDSDIDDEGFTSKFDPLMPPRLCRLLAGVDMCVFRGDNFDVVAKVDVVLRKGSELRIYDIQDDFVISDVHYHYAKKPLPKNDDGEPTTDTAFFRRGEIKSDEDFPLIVDFPGNNYNPQRYLTVEATVCRK